MSAEPPASPDKEHVPYRDGWGFQIPPHRLRLSDDGKRVTLTTADKRISGIYVVEIDETDDEELRIVVGKWRAGDKYPFPALEDEEAWLRKELAAAGEDAKDTARMEGETDDSYTTRLRGQLRALRARRLGR